MRYLARIFRKHQRLVLPVLVLVFLGCFVLAPQKVSAYTDNELMGDSIYLDAGAMTQAQIQAFLSSKGSYLATFGSPSERDGGGNVLASQIIFEAAQDYGINPQVILATLQKEQSLVTDPAPSTRQLTFAMGYGCPDSGSCSYPGFYKQVDNATWQFRFNYERASGNNSWWRAGLSYPCGGATPYYSTGLYPGRNVTFYDDNGTAIKTFIISSAPTASFYCYTPHPYNNPQGLFGKPVSGTTGQYYSGSYNFVYWFENWFGSVVGDLVRTANDASVYLVSGQNKYPISDGSVFNDFSVLGPVRYVSDASLSTKVTGSTLGHMVGGSDGTLYFVNAAIKLPFGSCAVVADYGYSCSQIPYLSGGQIAKLASGPYITSLYGTTSGKLYNISGGQKREVFDQQSLAQANISGSSNTLLESGLSYMPHGAPVIRNGVVVTMRNDGRKFLYDTNRFLTLNGDFYNSVALNGLTKGFLDNQSIPTAQRLDTFAGFVEDSAGTNRYLLTDTGKVQLASPLSWTSSFIKLDDVTLGGVAGGSQPVNNGLVKSASDGTVYFVTAAHKRPIPSWDDLTKLHISPMVINTLPDLAIQKISTGTMMYAPGRLVKVSDSATVYVVKNSTELFPLSSFVYTQELGVNSSLVTISKTDLDSYSLVSPTLTSKVACEGTYFVGNKGLLYEITSSLMTTYGFSTNEFIAGGDLCSNMPRSQRSLGSYIRTGDGTIYYVDAGQKHPISGYNVYQSLGGNADNTVPVSNYFVSLISTGSTL